MRYLRHLLVFFVFSNLFIAGCAVAMAWQTWSFILRSPPDQNFLSFVFFSTICSYSFHWYLTGTSVLPSERVVWVNRFRFVHTAGFVIGLTGAVVFFFYLRAHWIWLLLVAGVTFLYSAPKIPHPLFRSLRRIALGKTIFLALVWMMVTSFLPLVISDTGWHPAYTLFLVSRFFLIYAICILFDYRDREDDRVAGIRSLITYLPERGITLLFFGSLLVFAISTCLLYKYDYTILHLAILLFPGVVTALLYDLARRHFSDLFYYLLLDGLMAVSAFIMLIPGI